MLGCAQYGSSSNKEYRTTWTISIQPWCYHLPWSVWLLCGVCSVHLLFSKWYQDFGLVRQIHMYIRTITRNAYILHKKPHTQTHKQPGSVGAQFHSSVYGLPQRRNWSGIIVSSSSVLYDVDLRAEAQRVGWLGVKDQNGLMSLLFEELTEQRSNRLEIKVCSPGGWLDNMFEMGFFPPEPLPCCTRQSWRNKGCFQWQNDRNRSMSSLFHAAFPKMS